jgi:hypothetical protein
VKYATTAWPPSWYAVIVFASSSGILPFLSGPVNTKKADLVFRYVPYVKVSGERCNLYQVRATLFIFMGNFRVSRWISCSNNKGNVHGRKKYVKVSLHNLGLRCRHMVSFMFWPSLLLNSSYWEIDVSSRLSRCDRDM